MGGGGAGGVRWNKETETWEPVRTSAPPVPPSAPGPGRRLVRGVLGGAVAVGVAVALVLTLVVDGDSDGGGPSSAVGTSQGVRSATPSDEPPADVSGPTGSAASSAAALPVGFRRVDDPSGFSTLVPDGWTRREEKGGAVVFYTEPGDGLALLQIFEVVEDGYTPDRALDEAARSLSRRPGYEEIDRRTVAGEASASELVYAYDSEEAGVRFKAVDRVFRVDDGRLYAIIVRGVPDDWARTREILENARASFTPS